MLFEPCFGGEQPDTKTGTMEEPPRQKFGLHLLKLTTANSNEKMYSKKHLREKRVASLCWFAAELESYLTCSRRALSMQEKKSYIDAVLCLRSMKPALYKHEVRGTSSRYDDFQAVHINQSFIIHVNVCLSTAHRHQSINLICSPGSIFGMASMVHVDV